MPGRGAPAAARLLGIGHEDHAVRAGIEREGVGGARFGKVLYAEARVGLRQAHGSAKAT